MRGGNSYIGEPHGSDQKRTFHIRIFLQDRLLHLRGSAFFFKIGCFTFGGGWAILAQMEQEFVDKRQIITKSELLEMVAVGKSAPGIMITNISMLFGYHVAGVFGGLCAVFGITAPAVIILSIVTLFYNSFKDNYWVHAGLTGLRAAVVPIIGSAALSLGKDALRTPPAVVICLAAFCLSLFAGVSNILLVLLGVIGAMLWWGSTLVKKERVPEA